MKALAIFLLVATQMPSHQGYPPITLKQCQALNAARIKYGDVWVAWGAAWYGYTLEQLNYAIVVCGGK